MKARLFAISLASLIGGLVVGSLATLVERHFSPVGLFPLLVGIVLGGAIGFALRMADVRSLRLLVVAATVAAVACVAAMHLTSFVEARRAAEAKLDLHFRMMQAFPQKGLGIPAMPQEVPSLGDYYTQQWHVGRLLGARPIRGWWLLVWWIADGLLLAIGSLVGAFFFGGAGKIVASPRTSGANRTEQGVANS
jgi:hypothetical protein